MSIRFLLDENMPFDLIQLLTKKGHEVIHLKKIGKGGIRNGEVYQVAEAEGSWILTRDADFKNYQKFNTYQIKGIIVFVLNNTKTGNLIEVVNRFLEHHHDKLLSKHLIIIEDSNIRIYEPE